MGWIIAGAVVAVILILLMTSVKVRFDYSDPGELRLKISWLFVTLVRIPTKTKKQIEPPPARRWFFHAQKSITQGSPLGAGLLLYTTAGPADNKQGGRNTGTGPTKKDSGGKERPCLTG